MTINLS
ncbi:hypothetical protein AZE42_13969 [Rhizopogon vesiculosus]|nr:hypothetical protein AZE42_13969 [Rhizopogon vesiculosus]